MTPDDGIATNDLRDAFRKAMEQRKSGKAQRKSREKKVQSAVDTRSLKTTGRTAQLNVTIHPDLKQAITDYAKENGIKIVDLIERALKKEIGLKGN